MRTTTRNPRQVAGSPSGIAMIMKVALAPDQGHTINPNKTKDQDQD